MQTVRKNIIFSALVGQEDPGYPLDYFIPELLQPDTSEPTSALPYFFHAGETDEVGCGPDQNLFDAVLLNTSRIGHGFGLSRHPELRQAIAKKVRLAAVLLQFCGLLHCRWPLNRPYYCATIRCQGIAVEVCPLSNQVLMLVDDLRNHPGPTLWVAEGVMPLTVSPDDPAFWGAVGVSYDWFQFAVASGNETGLGMLKQLAINSWVHSALNATEVADGLAEWEVRWSAWVERVARLQP